MAPRPAANVPCVFDHLFSRAKKDKKKSGRGIATQTSDILTKKRGKAASKWGIAVVWICIDGGRGLLLFR